MIELKKTKQQNRILTVPNLLSFFRLSLIPLIIWQYVFAKRDVIAAVLLVISGITDIIDGKIARHFHMVSQLGKILDPIADKLTQLAMLFCLIVRFRWMAITFLILLLKELLAITLGIITIHKTQIIPSARWHGKLSTVILYSTILTHIIWINIPGMLSHFLNAFTILCMILSSVLYSLNSIKLLLSRHTNN